jgi:hypothetical protein
MQPEELLQVVDAIIARGDSATPALEYLVSDTALSLREHAAYLLSLANKLSHAASILHEQMHQDQEEAV